MYRIYYHYYKRKANWKDVRDIEGTSIIKYIESDSINGLNVEWRNMIQNFDCFQYALLSFDHIEEIKNKKEK